jgi:integrase
LQRWCAQRAGSGIDASLVASVELIEAKRRDDELPEAPSPEELGKLPWRIDCANCTSQTRLAALLVTLTAQRINTVLTAKVSQFKPCPHGGIWTIPRAHMKSKRPHVIPLPPATWDVVTQALAIAKSRGSLWLFPQVSARRKGDDAEGHLSYGPVSQVLSSLKPHDMRRGFATWGSVDLGMKLSDTKAVLDHAEGLGGDVTAQFYALHDGTHFKWGLMRAWEGWILEQANAALPVPGARLRSLKMLEG